MSQVPESQQPPSPTKQAISAPPEAKVAKTPTDIHERLQRIGREFVDICHYIILFLISVVVVWTAGKELLVIVKKGTADLKDILTP